MASSERAVGTTHLADAELLGSQVADALGEGRGFLGWGAAAWCLRAGSLREGCARWSCARCGRAWCFRRAGVAVAVGQGWSGVAHCVIRSASPGPTLPANQGPPTKNATSTTAATTTCFMSPSGRGSRVPAPAA
ncbi:hypothetical protein GCM10009815_07530 [Nocardioides marmoribigeumensis]